MSETLKRYDIIADAVSGADVRVWSDQYPDGKWVKYKDAKAVIDAKDKRIEELEARNAKLTSRGFVGVQEQIITKLKDRIEAGLRLADEWISNQLPPDHPGYMVGENQALWRCYSELREVLGK